MYIRFLFILFFIVVKFKVLLIAADDPIKILILSGSNNHDWEKTTMLLDKTFNSNEKFSSQFTYQPDTLRYNDLIAFDAIVSNFNTWPENEYRWPSELEQALLKYIEKGGGMVFFHASTSAFYTWPDFKNISTGAWIDETSHGRPAPAQVFITNQEHPITRGLKNFVIFDELWINAEQNDDFEVLAHAINEDAESKGHTQQAAVMIKKYGKGRVFNTILGHDPRAMVNTGFQTLMLRGTEWAAKGSVTLPIPQELKTQKNTREIEPTMVQSDTTLALTKNGDILWQFNFKDKYQKPYFHPLYVKDIRMTSLGPDDHIWHLGQWFSWKYINGINFWEYLDKTNYSMEGSLLTKDITFQKNTDHSATISYNIIYSGDASPLLEENTIISIHTPGEDGQLIMDYNMTFRALAPKVELGRTPPPTNGPDGKIWGGYAGLSIRFNQDFIRSQIQSAGGLIYEFTNFKHPREPRTEELKISRYRDTSVKDAQGNWLYLEMEALSGIRAGSAIFIHPETKGEGEAWYVVNSPETPFHYFSPAFLYHSPVVLEKNNSIQLKYRVLHTEGIQDINYLDTEYQKFISGRD